MLESKTKYVFGMDKNAFCEMTGFGPVEAGLDTIVAQSEVQEYSSSMAHLIFSALTFQRHRRCFE